MVRYSKLENDRKDTLFTFREGDLLFFGISRCNVKSGDKFDREKGMMIAKNRATKAFDLVKAGLEKPAEDGNMDNVNYFAHYGCIPLKDVKSLLQYFRTLATTVR